MTDLEHNVRAGMLTLEDLQQKIQGTLQPGEIVDATTWLASGGVRLITPVENDGNLGYELAHERLIPALREVAREELTNVDRVNQLLDRRVNEWLGNQRHRRYLFNWRELWSIRQQQPYLIWGANESHKEELLKRSWQQLSRQLLTWAMLLVFCLTSMDWWYSPWGQVQQVRCELAELSQKVDDNYRQDAAIAFFKDERLEKAIEITDLIADVFSNPNDKVAILAAIAEKYIKLANITEAEKYLQLSLKAAESDVPSYSAISYSAVQPSDQAEVLRAIVETYIKLKNTTEAEKSCVLIVDTLKQVEDLEDLASIIRMIADNFVQFVKANGRVSITKDKEFLVKADGRKISITIDEFFPDEIGFSSKDATVFFESIANITEQINIFSEWSTIQRSSTLDLREREHPLLADRQFAVR